MVGGAANRATLDTSMHQCSQVERGEAEKKRGQQERDHFFPTDECLDPLAPVWLTPHIARDARCHMIEHRNE